MAKELTNAMRPVVEDFLHELFRDAGVDGGFAPGEGVLLFLDGDYVAHIVVKDVEKD